MNTFQWLIVLGFPPAVAAATVAPEIFTDANTSDAEPTSEFLPRSAAA